MKQVAIKNNQGQQLAAWLYKVTENDQLVIFCHGYPSDSHGRHAMLAEFVSGLGKNALRFDYRGCGDSEGTFEECTVVTAANDLLAIIAWAREHGFKHITLIGASFGGPVALKAALETEIEEMILLAPAPDLTDPSEYSQYTTLTAWKEHGYYEQPNQQQPERLFRISYQYQIDAEQNIMYEPSKDIQARTLILHGTHDDLVPIEQSQELAEHMPQALLITLEGADHKLSIDGSYDELLSILEDWFSEEV